MKGRHGERHPFYENLVYGLLLLLAIIVGYYTVKTLVLGPGLSFFRGEGTLPMPAAPKPAEPHELASSGTFEAVSKLPPVRVVRGPHKKSARPARRSAVPSPEKKP